MQQISVMWHTACFSLFIRPSLLHLRVICRKFHLHANCGEFGHTPPRVPATFPLTSSRATHKHAHTQTLTDEKYHWSKSSTFPVTTHWTSIDTSAYTLHVKNAPTQITTSQSSVEWKPLLWHRGLWFWPLACYILMVQSLYQSFGVFFLKLLWTRAKVWRLRWFKNALKSADTFWQRPKLVQTGEISELIWSKKPSG